MAKVIRSAISRACPPTCLISRERSYSAELLRSVTSNLSLPFPSPLTLSNFYRSLVMRISLCVNFHQAGASGKIRNVDKAGLLLYPVSLQSDSPACAFRY